MTIYDAILPWIGGIAAVIHVALRLRSMLSRRLESSEAEMQWLRATAGATSDARAVTECEGCGAPVQPTQIQCSYCLRSTCVEQPMKREPAVIDVTTINDVRPVRQPRDDWA